MAERRTVALVAAAVCAAAFALYAGLACRDVAFGDGIELVASAIGNTRAPGHPLWTALGHLASLVPLGPPAYRVNATAAFYHAVTVALVYVAGYTITRRHGAALFAAASLALASPVFASWSLQAELFSLNDLFAAAIVASCLAWLHDGDRWRFAAPIALLFGVGCSNQSTIALLAPLPFWVAWCRRRDLPDGRARIALVAISAALCFAGLVLPHALGLAPVQVQRGGSAASRVFAAVAAGGWPYVAIALGVLGLWFRRRYAEVVFAGVAGATTFAFLAATGIDVSNAIARGVVLRFALLPLVTLAPFAACAAYAVEAALRERPLRVAAWALSLVALAGVTSQTLPAVSLRDVHDPSTLARDLFAALPPHAILLTAGAPVESAAAYYQNAERLRPDVTVVSIAGAQIAPNGVYVAGDPSVRLAGPHARALTEGVVSRVIPVRAAIEVRAHYAREIALQTAPGYAGVSDSFWQSNGYAGDVRALYAAGFYATARDAETLHYPAAARYWFLRASAYAP